MIHLININISIALFGSVSPFVSVCFPTCSSFFCHINVMPYASLKRYLTSYAIYIHTCITIPFHFHSIPFHYITYVRITYYPHTLASLFICVQLRTYYLFIYIIYMHIVHHAEASTQLLNLQRPTGRSDSNAKTICAMAAESSTIEIPKPEVPGNSPGNRRNPGGISMPAIRGTSGGPT